MKLGVQNSRLFYHPKERDKRSRYFKSVAFEVRFDIFSLLISDKWRLRSPKISQSYYRNWKLGKVYHVSTFFYFITLRNWLIFLFSKLKIWPFFHNCNWQHISKSSRLLPKIPAEMSKRLSLPTLDHFCGNLKHMFQVLEEQERKKIEQQQAADSHLESHVIHQYQSQIFLRLFAKAAWLPCLKRTSLLLPPFKNADDTKEQLPFFDRFMLTGSHVP